MIKTKVVHLDGHTDHYYFLSLRAGEPPSPWVPTATATGPYSREGKDTRNAVTPATLAQGGKSLARALCLLTTYYTCRFLWPDRQKHKGTNFMNALY